ncbi:Uncharacterised protein [Vibrio cholerae]|nr:Uncharacterised protein [Vibrio cholerae]
MQIFANLTHRVHHILQFPFRIGNTNLIDIGFAGDGTLKDRSFARRKTQPKSHRIRNRQNIRKQDRSIKRKTSQRL